MLWRIGAVLFITGLLFLGAFGGYSYAMQFLRDPAVPLIVKVGVTAIGVGFLVMLVGLLWERRKRHREAAEQRLEEVQY